MDRKSLLSYSKFHIPLFIKMNAYGKVAFNNSHLLRYLLKYHADVTVIYEMRVFTTDILIILSRIE